jgi:hypothetical protein
MPDDTPPLDLPVAGDPPSLFPSNFERLAFHLDWRSTWTHIVAGKFSDDPYDGLLFYEQSNGYAEFYGTDGWGNIGYLGSYDDWGNRWTHIVAGRFSDSAYTGLLLYDQQAGFAAVYQTDGRGSLTKLREYDGWGSSWTHVTNVRIPGSDYTALVRYDQAAGRGEILRCTGSGKFERWKTSDAWRTSWTHVVGDWRSGMNLLFYEGSTGHCEIYTMSDDDPNELGPMAQRDAMPPATAIIPGNFGWDQTGFLFYDRPTGRASFVFLYLSGEDITIGPETYTDWRTSWDLIVPGKFWEPDPEYTRFQAGFTDLLFYDASEPYAEFRLHEPFGAIIEQQLEGYASPGSVAQGEAIELFVNSRVGPFTIRVFRQDQDEVFMTELADVRQYGQPFPIGRLDYRDGPSWPPAGRLVIPINWPSGLYLARVEATGSSDSTVIPFVVRAAVPGSQATVLVFVPDTTYEAYNFWGGRSLYGFRSSVAPGSQLPVWSYGSTYAHHDVHQYPRAFRVSFRRPYNLEPGAVFPKWQYWEVPLLRWLARNGIAVEVCTATDLHKDGANHTGLLANYRLVVSVGHDEYWSKEMRDNVESFVAAGGNAAFFSANVCWFQIRFDLNGTRQICYKDARFDPFNPAHKELVTVNWYDTPVCRAETSLTGVSYYRTAGQAPVYRVLQPDHWVFEDIDPANLASLGLYNVNDSFETVVGYETDKFQPSNSNSCTPSSPHGFVKLAEVGAARPSGEPDYNNPVCTMGIRSHGKGQVFTAATINWSLGLTQSDRAWNGIDQVTWNVLSRLG